MESFSTQPGAGLRKLVLREEFDLSLPKSCACDGKSLDLPFWVGDDRDLIDRVVMLDQEGNVPPTGAALKPFKIFRQHQHLDAGCGSSCPRLCGQRGVHLGFPEQAADPDHPQAAFFLLNRYAHFFSPVNSVPFPTRGRLQE